ncbi:MAG: aspartate carbamoyltransferase [Patescibacteria group bacterium]
MYPYSHILSTNDFPDGASIHDMVVAGQKMVPYALARSAPTGFPTKKGTLLFLEPSTRTLGSFMQAMLNLMMRTHQISGAEGTSLVKKESFADTARMLADQGADVLVLRSGLEGGARWMAEVLEDYGREVTVLNGGDGRNQHPTQTMLDLLTILIKKGRLDNLHIGLVGDLANGRTAVSLIQALRHFENIRVTLVAPKGAEMLSQYKAGINVVCESESMEALKECDVIYVTRFQLERIADVALRLAVQGTYVFNKKFLDICKPDVIVMHPLPSVEEIDPDIKNDPRMVAFEQARYGIPTRMALIARALLNPFVGIGRPRHDADLLINAESIRIEDRGKPVKHFQPITTGTVIDHLPPNRAIAALHLLEQLTSIGDNHPRQLVQLVRSRKYEGLKDVMLLSGITLPDVAAATLQFIFPEITINEFPGNETQLKKRFHIPSHVFGVFRCLNSSCITNADPEAATIFRVLDRSTPGSVCRCHYCERDFPHDQLVARLCA